MEIYKQMKLLTLLMSYLVSSHVPILTVEKCVAIHLS